MYCITAYLLFDRCCNKLHFQSTYTYLTFSSEDVVPSMHMFAHIFLIHFPLDLFVLQGALLLLPTGLD